MRTLYRKSCHVLLCVLLISVNAAAQGVAINNDGSAANSSAILDVKSLTKGVLIPRTKVSAILTPVRGLLIYDTTTGSFWYHDGTVWNEISKGRNWSTTGNSGMIDGTNFLGTTDGVPLVFKVNNQKAGKIDYQYPFNFSMGYNTLFSLTTGYANTALGGKALYSNTSGYFNTATGYSALYSNDIGTSNTATGYQALMNNTSGDGNSALGSSSLFSNTIGSGNTALGNAALYSNINPSYNTAIGDSAMFLNSSGNQNTAVGALSMRKNTTGYNNTAIGFSSLFSNKSGNQNTAAGNFALYNDTTGWNNTGIGFQSLYSNTSANDNTAVGAQSLYSVRFGARNTALGTAALYSDTSGNNNTAMGYQALYSNLSGSENNAYGANALFSNLTGIQNTALGNRALENMLSGTGNTAIGYNAMRLAIDGSYNTAIGDSATIGSGSLTNSTAIGCKAVVNTSNSMAFGDANVNRWAFGRTNVATGVLQVGTGNTNGNGAYLTAGGVWTDISDRTLKEDIQPLDSKRILEDIMRLPVTKWRYIGTDEYHIGPMAQDFQKIFGIGDGRSLSAMDKSGVALLGIQALKKENDDLQNILDDLTRRVEKLEQSKK